MKQLYILAHAQARANAIRAVQDAPEGYVVTIAEPTRTLEQSALMWATLNEIAKQVDWHGNKLAPEEWKHIFSAALKGQKAVPNLDGSGFVVLGVATSKMSKREMSDLITMAEAFGAEKGVKFNVDDHIQT